MDKTQALLIIGFGSIGQRHYKNLQILGYKNLFIYEPDREKTRPAGVQEVRNLSQETLKKFKAVFICNPTSLHVLTALQCAEAGCHLFIEKPISHTQEGVQKLIALCKKKRLVSFVACNLRFLPAIQRIHQLLQKGFLGKVHALYLEYGRYLPYQRPGRDYKSLYAAQKKLGGGIMLDDIHDFDLLFWLNNFSDIVASNIITGKVSALEIDTEDICSAHFKFKNNSIGGVRCDYLQQYKHKDIKIIGEKGNIFWEFRENIVWLESMEHGKETRKKLFSGRKTDDENSYKKEIQYFLACVDAPKKTFNDVGAALQTLKAMGK